MVSCKTIMVVEDDEDIRNFLSEALILEGYKVTTAENGKKALELLAVIEKPALIFLDIMMPIMDGHKFLEILRKDVALAPIPVIVTSAHPDISNVKGANSLIRKPFNLDSIVEVAKELCG